MGNDGLILTPMGGALVRIWAAPGILDNMLARPPGMLRCAQAGITITNRMADAIEQASSFLMSLYLHELTSVVKSAHRLPKNIVGRYHYRKL